MTDYSQNGEQPIILDLWAAHQKLERKDQPVPHPGRFLEIGAWDPIHFSNTRALIELGWSGVIIEPSPGPIINLLRCCTLCGYTPRELEAYGDRKQAPCSKCAGVRYGYNDHLKIIAAAVSIGGGLIELEVTDDALSMLSDDTERLAQWRSVGGFYGKLTVPSIKPIDLFNQYGGDWDLISIDTEGTSVPLLIDFLGCGIRPWIFVVEHDSRVIELNQHLERENYRQAHINQTNCVFELKGR